MIELTLGFAADANGAAFVAPTGFGTPHLCPVAVSIEGADHELVASPGAAQWLMLGQPEAERITLTYRFAAGGVAYPEAMFTQRDSRYLRAASALASEARLIAEDAGGGDAGLRALIDHTATLFHYGHTDDRFYDEESAVPQLCGLTQGSCVDINLYLIAALRAAGYEAGYVTGFFIPAEKRTHTTDMHCWVVTRLNGVAQEWDIAHHMKMGVDQVAPGLNPKPGVRVPVAHSMGWDVPAIGVNDHKLMAHPQWVRDGALEWIEEIDVRLGGYDLLQGQEIG